MLTGDVTGLRGVDLGVRDVAAQARFYTDVWRLSVVAERNGSAYLRGSGGYGFAFHPAAGATLHHIAFEMDGIDSVMRGAGRMRDANHRVRAAENWVYPPGQSDLWGATPPPSARMKAAQEKIRFAEGLFHP